MNWYYANGGKQAGPVDDAELQSLLRTGKVTRETLVWREGMANWAPYGEVASSYTERVHTQAPGSRSTFTVGDVSTTKSFAGTSAGPTAAGASTTGGAVLCASCGGEFQPDQVIRLEGKFICANCKGEAVQRMIEGAEVVGNVDAEELGNRIAARGIHAGIGEVLGSAWDTLKSNFLANVGVTLLAFILIWVAASIISSFANIFVQPHLIAGLYIYYLKQIRGERASVNDVFLGFKHYGPLAMAGFVITLVSLVLASPLLFLGLSMPKSGEAPHLSGLALGGLGVLGFIFILVLFYLTMAWMYVFPLILEKRIGWKEAMRLSRRVVSMKFFWFIGFGLVCGLVVLAGALALGVGLFVALPLVMCAQAHLYERIFGENQTNAA